MFNVVAHRGKRRAWSARTVAISAGAHLLVLGMIAVAATNTQADPPDEEEPGPTHWWEPQKKQPGPPAPAPAAPRPGPAKPVLAESPEQPPEGVPTQPPGPGATPQPSGPGEEPAGGGTGTPTPTPGSPAGNPDPLPDRDSILDGYEAERLPQLLNPREAQRMLERVYPDMLRDAGVTGRTTVQLVIDRNGAVQPGSVTVQETTHEAFRDAAVRVAERFRFRPAMVNGEPVAIRISIPIEWSLQP
jgi:TonB family protein